MMRRITICLAFATSMCLLNNAAQAQFKSLKSIGKAATNVAENAAGDMAANKVSDKLVAYMDKSNKLSAADSKYSLRLDSITSKYATVDGLALNYKVYENSEVNVLACANGSIRVYSGAMDAFNNNELLALIAHQIGHIVNKDTRDAMMKVCTGDNAGKATSAQLDKVLSFSDDKLGTLTNELIQTPYSPEQEAAADDYAYTFLKSKGEEVKGLVTALEKINTMKVDSEAKDETSLAAKFDEAHPGSASRASLLRTK